MGHNFLKTGNEYGAKIGGHILFTKAGAMKYYHAALETAYRDFNPGSAAFLSEVQNDLVKMGFGWEELEEIEIAYIKTL